MTHSSEYNDDDDDDGDYDGDDDDDDDVAAQKDCREAWRPLDDLTNLSRSLVPPWNFAFLEMLKTSPTGDLVFGICQSANYGGKEYYFEYD